VPKVARLSNINGTQKIKMIQNYAIYDVVFSICEHFQNLVGKKWALDPKKVRHP